MPRGTGVSPVGSRTAPQNKTPWSVRAAALIVLLLPDPWSDRTIVLARGAAAELIRQDKRRGCAGRLAYGRSLPCDLPEGKLRQPVGLEIGGDNHEFAAI